MLYTMVRWDRQNRSWVVLQNGTLGYLLTAAEVRQHYLTNRDAIIRPIRSSTGLPIGIEDLPLYEQAVKETRHLELAGPDMLAALEGLIRHDHPQERGQHDQDKISAVSPTAHEAVRKARGQ